MPTIPADTTPEAWELQFAIYRQRTPERRLQIAMEMSDCARELCAVGVRGRHPDYAEKQVRLAVARITLGDDLFRRTYPNVEIDVRRSSRFSRPAIST